MKNVQQVCENLTYVFEGLKSGDIKSNVACEMNNACGKVLAAAKLQLEYMKMLKEPSRISLLEQADSEKLPSLPSHSAG
jgi:hypothetical protein